MASNPARTFALANMAVFVLVVAGFLLLLDIGRVDTADLDYGEPQDESSVEVRRPDVSFADESRTSYTRAGDIRDVSYANTRRFALDIFIPEGRTREEVRATLRRAARDLQEDTNAKAVMVFAYRPDDDPEGTYSVGRAVYAPDGEWGEAGSGAPMQMTLDLRDFYFNRRTPSAEVGDTVELRAAGGEHVALSDEYGSWHDEDIIVRVKPGTTAEIIRRRSQTMADTELVRYLIRVHVDSREYEGWVHREHVERE